MRVHAFQALRPTQDLAARVAAVPYDVIDTDRAARLVAGNPHSFLHVTHSEIDLPVGTDLYADEVYSKAVENFAAFQANGTLLREDEPAMYVYRQTRGSHVQNGIVTCCHIEDYETGVIRQHERTRHDKQIDRARHIRELNANAGPVFFVYRDRAAINTLVSEYTSSEPINDFTLADGVRHTVWRIADSDRLRAEFEKVPSCCIADGHHRCAGAVKVGSEQRDANPAHTGREEYNWLLGALFPASQLKIMPYNRVVSDLNHMPVDVFLKRVRERFGVRPTTHGEPPAKGTIAMYVHGEWYELVCPAPRPDAGPADSLDISILQDELLAPMLGIDDPRSSDRIEFVGGIHGPGELARLVDSGRALVGFSMYPVSLDELLAVSDAGMIMPPKSTWFEPKLLSGLFVHTL